MPVFNAKPFNADSVQGAGGSRVTCEGGGRGDALRVVLQTQRTAQGSPLMKGVSSVH